MSWSVDIIVKHPDGYVETFDVVDGHTYNLTPMWCLAGVVRSATKELDGQSCRAIAPVLIEALARALRFRKSFEVLNPENGWGDYEGFITILTRFAQMAWEHPTGTLRWVG